MTTTKAMETRSKALSSTTARPNVSAHGSTMNPDNAAESSCAQDKKGKLRVNASNNKDTKQPDNKKDQAGRSAKKQVAEQRRNQERDMEGGDDIDQDNEGTKAHEQTNTKVGNAKQPRKQQPNNEDKEQENQKVRLKQPFYNERLYELLPLLDIHGYDNDEEVKTIKSRISELLKLLD